LGGTPFDSIPPYLKSVTVLDPEGDIAAEVVGAVERLASETTYRKWLGWRPGIVLAVVAVLVASTAVGFLFMRSSSMAPVGKFQPVEPQSFGTGAQLLEQLRKLNVLTSVEPASMQNWLELPDQKYRRIAEATLAVLKSRRLKDRANLDVVAYKYARLLGLQSEDDMPPKPEIDTSTLSNAVVWAYNEQHGTRAKSLDEIVD
jgi:hypothetical protein